jgi:hypothetical protein
MNKPVYVLQHNSDVNDVVNMAAIAAMDIQVRKTKHPVCIPSFQFKE